MRSIFLPALICILGVQLLACLLQLEWWPLTGHGLYSRSFHYSQARFHRVSVEFNSGRVETGIWTEFRSYPEDESSLQAWCRWNRNRPNFRAVSGKLSRFENRNGKIVMLADQEENICGS